MAKNKFPKQIFVGIEQDDDDDFLVAVEDYEGLMVCGADRGVGIYQLVRVAKIVNKSEIVD